ncbi:HNH endonuclease signature motif containing protein [Marinilabilia salmonicolor]|uniref:HNH endonuclease signature motif containing protein n=2 Tax=Marinilabilia salmonicolor TaxID=989 RepID=UPI00029AD895|nr:HNH endonuclease signature motif containing protein [Marinilabilia salmonicolor]
MGYKFKWEQQKHKHKDGMTDVSQAGFYNTSAWKKLRNVFIKTYPLCKDCEKQDRLVPAKYVDHIVPLTLENFWEYGLDWNNLQSLCAKCHQKKTNRSKTNSKYSATNLQRGKELQNKFNDFTNGNK